MEDQKLKTGYRTADVPTGFLFDIERYATHDGPGIRTTVFMKGCPLSCLWCHNPESISTRPTLLITAEKCIGCHACVDTCPQGAHRFLGDNHLLDRDLCQSCGQCAQECFAGALELAGKSKSIDEVLEEVLMDRNVYEHSGGGMTISGGEPMIQYPFTRALVEAAHNAGIHVAVDTSGYTQWRYLEEVSSFTDLFLYDIKQMDSEKHKELTGVPNERIHENLRKLDQLGIPIWIRMPLIPGLNDSDENYHAIGRFLQPMQHVERIEILRYHPLAEAKYEHMGLRYPLEGLETPSESVAISRKAILEDYGLRNVKWH